MARREIPLDSWFVAWRVAQLLGEELPEYIEEQLELNLPPEVLCFHDHVGVSREEAMRIFRGDCPMPGQVYRDFIPERNLDTNPGVQRLDLSTGMVVCLDGDYMLVHEPFTAGVARDEGHTLLAFYGDNRRQFKVSKFALPQKASRSNMGALRRAQVKRLPNGVTIECFSNKK